jgi:ATP-dependent Clp protease ATP-binding subunit ClpA
MLTTLDVLGLFSAALPWLHRAKVRRLERVAERVPFSAESRHAIERAQTIALAEGENAVSPVHLARAAHEFRTSQFQVDGSRPDHAVLTDPEGVLSLSLPFTYAALLVLVEALRVAADDRHPVAMPDHLLVGVLRKRTRHATRFLTSRGVTLESLAGPDCRVQQVRA